MGYMTGIVVAGMLTFGTCTVVIQKLILSMQGVGRDGTTHQFKKPWFQTEAMFIGMFGCLAVYEVMRCVQRAKQKNAVTVSEATPLVNSDSARESKPKSKMPVWKQYCIVCTPALCDMCATAMMNVGLLCIPASVWQMLRGSMVIFSAVFSKVFLKRRLHASHWIGVGIVAFALVVVAFAALEAPGLPEGSSEASSSTQATTAQAAFGCALVVIAQIIQASQIVVEEYLLKEIVLHPVLVVGLEGMWGTIVCSILLCFTGYIPTKYGGEDTLDTLYMFFHNGKILGFGILYAAVILCYNLFGMFVTSYTSAVLRTILEGLRCACIWVTNLFIFYVIVGPNPHYGEVWSNWSYLQFCGFLFLLLGMFVYNGIARIEGLYYEDKDPFMCDISAKMGANPAISTYAKDPEFMNEVKYFQSRDGAMDLKDHLLAMRGKDGKDMNDLKLQTLEAMVGITPAVIVRANKRWDEERQKQQAAANGQPGIEVGN